MEKYYIYSHTNLINGKKYIGQTCQNPPERRWRNGYGYGSDQAIGRAIQKYGWENFSHEILAECETIEEANALEQQFIIQFDSMNPNLGYNMCEGGWNARLTESAKEKLRQANLGKKYGEERSIEISKRMSGRHWYNNGEINVLTYECPDGFIEGHTQEYREQHSERLKGREQSEEEKAKRSASLMSYYETHESHMVGKHHSEETKQKMSVAQSGENNHFYGKTHSEETRARLSESIKNVWQRDGFREHMSEVLSDALRGEKNPFYGKHHSDETKLKIQQSRCKNPVRCVETGEVFLGVRDVEHKLGFNHSQISKCCKDNNRTCHGYHWEYVESEVA